MVFTCFVYYSINILALLGRILHRMVNLAGFANSQIAASAFTWGTVAVLPCYTFMVVAPQANFVNTHLLHISFSYDRTSLSFGLYLWFCRLRKLWQAAYPILLLAPCMLIYSICRGHPTQSATCLQVNTCCPRCVFFYCRIEFCNHISV